MLGLARHSEPLEPLVVYQALYAEGRLWVRPEAMGTERVDLPGGRVQRFTFLAAE